MNDRVFSSRTRKSAEPAAALVAQHLARQINQGRWVPGQKLPPVRTLASQHGVSVNSIQSALRQLQGRGLVQCEPRRGNYVHPRLNQPTGKARQIGFVRYHAPGSSKACVMTLPERDAWGQNILRGAEETLAGSDYNLTLLSSIGQDDWGLRAMERITQMRDQLAGVMLYAMPGLEPLIHELDRHELPWVTINRYATHQTHNFVNMDYLDAALTVGRLFNAMDLKRVVVLTVDLARSVSCAERALGLMQARLLDNLPLNDIHTLDCEDWFEASACQVMQSFLQKHPPPQAIFSTGDFLAIGAIRACMEHGLDVPGDVSVVGSSGLDMARYTRPALSLVEQPLAQIGQAASHMLLRMIDAGQMRIPGQFLPGRLILRDSTHVTPDRLHALRLTRTSIESP